MEERRGGEVVRGEGEDDGRWCEGGCKRAGVGELPEHEVIVPVAGLEGLVGLQAADVVVLGGTQLPQVGSRGGWVRVVGSHGGCVRVVVGSRRRVC